MQTRELLIIKQHQNSQFDHINQRVCRVSGAETAWKMNFNILRSIFLFCGLTLAHSGVNTTEMNPYHPDMCNLLKDFGAVTEKVKSMETRLKETEIRLKETVTRLKDSENQILELQSKERTKIIFSATAGRGDAHIGPFNTDIIIDYKKVITNFGNAYSPVTGVFTAPVAGVYYFTIFYHGGRSYSHYLRIFKNNEMTVITSDHKTESDGADNGGNAVFLQLEQGDQVYVSMAANTYVW
uniref:C1q domain-containing protein n=1 Tax=Oreochromis aureus TaxID=47969 RepID=A0A668T5J6_OREAU